jgi:hypothetical protein
MEKRAPKDLLFEQVARASSTGFPREHQAADKALAS